MARLPYLTKEDLPEEHQHLLARDFNLAKLLAHSPGGAKYLGGLGNWIRHESRLDARLRELAILQVGYLTRTPYEYSHHIKIGRDFGLSDDDIRAVADGADGARVGIDGLAQTVLRASREITEDQTMSQETFDSAREALGEEGVLDLTIVVSFYNAVIRVLKTLDIDVEAEYQPYLDEFPLPKP